MSSLSLDARRRVLETGNVEIEDPTDFRTLIFRPGGSGARSFTVSLIVYGSRNPTVKYYSSSTGVPPASVDQFVSWNYSAITGSGTNTVLYVFGSNTNGFSWSAEKYCTFSVTSNTPGVKVLVYGKIMALVDYRNSGTNNVPASHCFYKLFLDQTDIELNPAIINSSNPPAQLVMASNALTSCYEAMFAGCTGITGTSPALPSTSCGQACYIRMFKDCTSLQHVGIFGNNSTSMSGTKYACLAMFQGCTSLISARIPVFSQGTSIEYVYQYMFYNCENLTTLHFTTIGRSDKSSMTACCQYMFYNCKKLVTPPALPAVGINTDSYSYMFWGCTSLTSAPALPATTINGGYDYAYMFYNCVNLTVAPVLPATGIATHAYDYMFYGCSKLGYIKAMMTFTPGTTYTNNWVAGVAPEGVFVKNSAATWNVTGVHGVPSGWTIQTASS